MADPLGIVIQQCPSDSSVSNPSEYSSPTSTGPVAISSNRPNTGSAGGAAQQSIPQPSWKQAVHRVEFNFKLDSGEPISDNEPFTLIYPDGREESGRLSNGNCTRDGVPEGVYEIRFKHIASCSWTQSYAQGEPTVTVIMRTSGYDDGTAVTLTVFRRFDHLHPLVVLTAYVKSGIASADYQYIQKVGDVAGGEFVCQAQIGMKVAFSDPLRIDRYSSESLAGIQQRLKELGYDPGPTNGEQTIALLDAVRAFQHIHPELNQDGIVDLQTKQEIERS